MSTSRKSGVLHMSPVTLVEKASILTETLPWLETYAARPW
jgi:hypothetical protein